MVLSYRSVYLLVFAFIYILGWAAIFNKGLGVGEETVGMRKHVPEPVPEPSCNIPLCTEQLQ